MHAPPAIDRATAARLHALADAARWDVSVEEFSSALDRSAAHAFGASQPDAREMERYLSSLHLADLALALACAAGHERAWAHFMAEYRPLLARAAAAIDPVRGADLADGIYAELYGLTPTGDARASLFRYFHGRSRLATWLRALLAQRHVDRLRATRRDEPLPDDDASTPQFAAPTAAGPARAQHVARMREALAHATATLPPRDRVRLACYYADNLTLAAIGRMLGEHEATVSRQLARTRQVIRLAAEAHLREHHGLDDARIAECVQAVCEDAGSLDLADILDTGAGRKNHVRDRSRE